MTATPALDLHAHDAAHGLDPQVLTRAQARLAELYAQVAAAWPGFGERAGQRQMMEAALLTFLHAKAPEDTHRPGDHVAALEAGTGTGKTVAYCLAAIVAAEVLNKKVIVSTATVALQEQLMHKDLPRLAEIVPTLKFDILKGRARYLCEARLEGALNDDGEGMTDEWTATFGADAAGRPGGTVDLGGTTIPRDQAKFIAWAKRLSQRWHANTWDGEQDSLEPPPEPADWQSIQANAHACTGGQCAFYRSCAFFKARRQAATATLQVANHALILATLQTDSALIDPGNTLFVFDEAHHLPHIAGDQFTHHARVMGSIRLLSSLRSVALRHALSLPASTRPDPVAFSQLVTTCTDHLAALDKLWQASGWLGPERTSHRFAHGQIPPEWAEVCSELAKSTAAVAKEVKRITDALLDMDEGTDSDERSSRTRAAVELGAALSRLDTLHALMNDWARHDKIPLAKWLTYVPPYGTGGPANPPDATFSSSPMTAAQVLSHHLWRRVSAAVCTSATLTACGRFDFFERLAGLNRYPAHTSLVVASPFDHANQGELHIPQLTHNPKSAAFSDELCALLPRLLRGHERGQLALFTSRRQMQACYEALPPDLKAQTQMQGDKSRREMLRTHAERVEAGGRSVLFGLQSFGEGIDLPGALCEHVIIDKLPFTPPDSPVEEALAEWLTAQGRDPFVEISVPRAAMKLAQWTGRGLRTLTDRAIITVCDTRLVTMRYGALILKGLPPFPLKRLPAA